MTEPEPDELDIPRFVLAAQELGTAEDLQRMGRVQRATDSADDRAHLRLLIVRALDECAPGPPAELERVAKLTVASMRGAGLRAAERGGRGLPPPRG